MLFQKNNCYLTSFKFPLFDAMCKSVFLYSSLAKRLNFPRPIRYFATFDVSKLHEYCKIVLSDESLAVTSISLSRTRKSTRGSESFSHAKCKNAFFSLF